jgi:hypothetical protein
VASPPTLAVALEANDPVGVGLAIRTDGAIVPTVVTENGTHIRTFRRDDSADTVMVVLFSSVEAYTAMVPGETNLTAEILPPAQLLEFLRANEAALDSVWFDFGGEHSMQAAPADIITTLELPRA